MKPAFYLQGIEISDLEALIKKLIAEGIIDVLHKNEQRPPQKDKSKYLTRHEVAALLSISLPTLSRYSQEGIIQSYRIGSRVRYKAEEVDKALQVVRNQKYKT